MSADRFNQGRLVVLLNTLISRYYTDFYAFQSLCEEANDKVIYINSFENLLPLGMKLSFAVLPKAILADFQQKYDSFSCPVSLLEQAAMTEFINKGYLNDYLSTLKNI